jgi:hypothetical protein
MKGIDEEEELYEKREGKVGEEERSIFYIPFLPPQSNYH